MQQTLIDHYSIQSLFAALFFSFLANHIGHLSQLCCIESIENSILQSSSHSYFSLPGIWVFFSFVALFTDTQVPCFMSRFVLKYLLACQLESKQV